MTIGDANAGTLPVLHGVQNDPFDHHVIGVYDRRIREQYAKYSTRIVDQLHGCHVRAGDRWPNITLHRSTHFDSDRTKRINFIPIERAYLTTHSAVLRN